MSPPLQFNLIMIIIIGNKLSRNMLIIYVNKESKLTSSTEHDNIKEQTTEKIRVSFGSCKKILVST